MQVLGMERVVRHVNNYCLTIWRPVPSSSLVMQKVNYLKALQSIVPPLSPNSHKGVSGRIGIIGGSLEYTGAPFFAGIAALKTGADLGHIFCPEEAAVAIKSYSPELIVHPLLSTNPSEKVLDSITTWFPRLHALVIGPGLGRDPGILQNVKKIIQVAKHQQKNMVIDADGLFLVTNEPDVIVGYSKAILTLNGGEFSRLYNKMLGKALDSPLEGNTVDETKTLASKMGGVTILRKGKVDIISDGITVISCSELGSMRRCGGQGDVLSGIAALFYFWATQAEVKLQSELGLTPTLMAAYGSCLITRMCAHAAFQKHHRAMLAYDLVSEISSVFRENFDQF